MNIEQLDYRVEICLVPVVQSLLLVVPYLIPTFCTFFPTCNILTHSTNLLAILTYVFIIIRIHKGPTYSNRGEAMDGLHLSNRNESASFDYFFNHE